MGCKVTSGIAGGAIRMGVYNTVIVGGQRRPGNLVATFPAVSLISGGVKSADLGAAIILEPGLYWLAGLLAVSGTMHTISPSGFSFWAVDVMGYSDLDQSLWANERAGYRRSGMT